MKRRPVDAEKRLSCESNGALSRRRRKLQGRFLDFVQRFSTKLYWHDFFPQHSPTDWLTTIIASRFPDIHTRSFPFFRGRDHDTGRAPCSTVLHASSDLGFKFLDRKSRRFVSIIMATHGNKTYSPAKLIQYLSLAYRDKFIFFKFYSVRYYYLSYNRQKHNLSMSNVVFKTLYLQHLSTRYWLLSGRIEINQSE